LVGHLAAAGLHQRVISGTVRPPVAVGVRRARHHDETGVERVQLLPPEAQTLQHAGAERLDDDVGGRAQGAERVGVRRRLQVEYDRAPAPVPAPITLVGAEGVTTGRLDLDHFGAVLGQEKHAQGAGDAP